MFREKRFISFLTAILLLINILPVSAAAADNTSLRIAVISDIHYLSPENIADTAAFHATMEDGRPLLAESEAIFDYYLQTVREEKPNVLLIPGDLSCDGERTSHEAVAQRLRALQADLPDMKIYIVNGNHDINNPGSRNYKTPDGIPVAQPSVTQDEFRAIYGFIYEDASVVSCFTPPEGQRSGGLSYAARPCDGVTILVLDTCTYTADVTSSGLDRREGTGRISPALEAWILDESAAAHERGDVILAMTHYNIIPHFSLEPIIYSDFIIEQYTHVEELLANAGIPVIFTGHMHANDIAAYTSASRNPLYDVMTASCVTYPSCMRFAALQRDGREVSLDIRTVYAQGMDYKDPLTGDEKHIDDLREYGLAHGFSAKSLLMMLSGFLHKFVNLLTVCDAETTARIENCLKDHMDNIVPQICEIQVDEDHTLLDAVNRVYYMMLAGEDNGRYPDWVQSVLDRTESGELIDRIINIVKREAFGEWADCAQFKGLFTCAAERLLGVVVVRLADVLGKDSNYRMDNNTTICLTMS